LEEYHKEQTNPMYSTLWVLNEGPKEIFSEAKKVVIKILKLIQFAEVSSFKVLTALVYENRKMHGNYQIISKK
jgi:hypothetical protein